jgi:hypothetical protein
VEINIKGKRVQEKVKIGALSSPDHNICGGQSFECPAEPMKCLGRNMGKKC